MLIELVPLSKDSTKHEQYKTQISNTKSLQNFSSNKSSLPSFFTDTLRDAISKGNLDSVKKEIEKIGKKIDKDKYNDSVKNKINSIYEKYTKKNENNQTTQRNGTSDSAQTSQTTSNNLQNNPAVSEDTGTELKIFNQLPSQKLVIDPEAISWVLIGVAVLTILNLLFWLVLRSSVRSLRKKVASRSGSSDKKDEIQSLQNRISALEKILKEEIQVLKQEIATLKTQNAANSFAPTQNPTTVQPISKPANTTSHTFSQPKEEAQANPTSYFKVLYAKNPDRKEGFSNHALSQENNINAIYTIELSDETTADLSINSGRGDAMSKALTDTNAYLTACIATNSSMGKTSIRVLEKGTVVLEGALWVIKKPVKIEYI